MSRLQSYLLMSIWIIVSYLPKDVQGQDSISIMEAYEAKLVALADSLLYNSIPVDKPIINEHFVKMLRTALAQPNSYEYPFGRLKQVIHIIQPEDKSFKIFNWVVVISSFQRRYYGAIQMSSSEMVLHPLFDKSEQLEKDGRGLAQVTNREWYGCEYYNIKTIESADGKIYNLFGHNNNLFQSRKKLVDVLTFDNGIPTFGLPIFATPDGTINRLIVEYKKDAFVNLNYNEDQKMIIFDRLISEIGDPGKRFTYVPSGQMDGFRWDGGSWRFVPNAIKIQRLQDGQAPVDGVFPE